MSQSSHHSLLSRSAVSDAHQADLRQMAHHCYYQQLPTSTVDPWSIPLLGISFELPCLPLQSPSSGFMSRRISHKLVDRTPLGVKSFLNQVHTQVLPDSRPEHLPDLLLCNVGESYGQGLDTALKVAHIILALFRSGEFFGGFLSPAEEAHFVRAYSATELRTFHCERVRKMPLTGLDPSMLLGFVCRDEADCPEQSLRSRTSPPTWPGADDNDDMGLESISDPEEEPLFEDRDVSSASHALSSSAHAASNTSHGAAGEVDTEDDPVAPVTPLPGARFDLSGGPSYTGKAGAGDKAEMYLDLLDDEGFVDAGGEAEIEDDWIDPVTPPPPSKKEKERERAAKRKSGKSKGKIARRGRPLEYQRQERQRNVTVSPKNVASGGQRMHTARARDGGRTRSGGVRGVLTTED
ncbi:hypothetical protein B0H17DRAFT_1337141 [Mycena rosella]|uniref:Cysteine protease n=1 Tax=Mycena rosella TaxID=1033263 RepID=A0AAD7CTB6_MYCRO|nr:hypothetical protein B0H17DRAFT_1337141 [Mycena rosella]